MQPVRRAGFSRQRRGSGLDGVVHPGAGLGVATAGPAQEDERQRDQHPDHPDHPHQESGDLLVHQMVNAEQPEDMFGVVVVQNAARERDRRPDEDHWQHLEEERQALHRLVEPWPLRQWADDRPPEQQIGKDVTEALQKMQGRVLTGDRHDGGDVPEQGGECRQSQATGIRVSPYPTRSTIRDRATGIRISQAGSPSSRRGGTNSVSSMCWTMCAVSRYQVAQSLSGGPRATSRRTRPAMKATR